MSCILIIDDDPTTRLLLRHNLERQGHDVSVAEDGHEGVELAHKITPDLVICDWMMPTMDGLEVCRILKAHSRFSTTFFILLTARTEVEDRVEGLDAGADEFLSKPIDANELQARVRAGLRLHQLSADLQQQTEQLRSELNQAANYVRSLLPPPQTFQNYQIEADWQFIPSQELGGDCFSFHWLDPDHLALYLQDVSGHGVGAALLSVSVTNQLRSQSLSIDFKDPKSVLKALNHQFQMSDQSELYFTVWYGVYQVSTQTLAYSSGGHPPAVLVHYDPESEQDPDVTLLRTPNLPVGMVDSVDYRDDQLLLHPPCELYLFSDGIYETSEPQGQVWGLEAFTQSICQPGAMGAPLELLIQAAQHFTQSAHFEDDVSLLRLQFKA